MKRIFSFIAALFMLSANAITAYAMPQEAQNIEVKSSNLTQDCEYIDILIQLSEDDSDYTAYNEANMKQCSFDTKELSEFRDDDGFISLSCHFKDNFTRMKIITQEYGGQTVSLNNFVLKGDTYTRMWKATDRMKKLRELNPKFKVAVLDKNGSIIQTSKPFELENDSGYLWGDVNYDVQNNKVTLEWEKTTTREQARQFEILIIAAIVFVFIILPAIIVLIIMKLIKKERHKQNCTYE